MKQYRRYISVLNLQWRYTYRIFMGVLGLLAVTQAYFFHRQMRTASFTQEMPSWAIEGTDVNLLPWSLRFEEYMARSYIKEIFLISLILTLILLIATSFWQRSNSRIDYTIKRLPIKEKTWYVTSIIHCFQHLIILLAMQLTMIFVVYYMYLNMIPKEVQMTQALFLSFFRWDFLQGLYPISYPLKQIYCILVLISLSLLIVYLQTCLIKKHNFILILFGCGFAYMDYFSSITANTLYFNIFLLLLMSGVMIYLMSRYWKED